MKSELKIEFKNDEVLNQLIQKSYFEDGQMGTLKGKQNTLEINENEDILYTILKGMNNSTIKIQNEKLIEGSFRLIVEENQNEIKLTPISTYCITLEDGRYSFY